MAGRGISNVSKRVLWCWPILPSQMGTRIPPDIEIVPFGGAQGELGRAALDVSAVLVRRGYQIDQAVIEQTGSLEFVQRAGTNCQNIDLRAARVAGVRVAAWPMHIDVSVAEHALLMMLGLARKVIEGDRAVRSGAYHDLGLTPVQTDESTTATNWMGYPAIPTLFGRTLGVVGFGEIGQLLAIRAASLGMRVLYSQRRPLASPNGTVAATYVALDDLLAQSDFVSLHVPLTVETTGLVNAAFLGKMQRSAFLVNASRGPVIDEQSLVLALAQGQIAGAGLDVFGWEPLQPDSPLATAPNTLLSPHVASGTDIGTDLAGLIGNIARALQGGEFAYQRA